MISLVLYIISEVSDRVNIEEVNIVLDKHVDEDFDIVVVVVVVVDIVEISSSLQAPLIHISP